MVEPARPRKVDIATGLVDLCANGDLVATLYERRGGSPFVHLLHTVETYAQCLDLPVSAAPSGYVLAGVDRGTLWITDTAGRARFRADLTASQPQIAPVT